MPQRRADDSAAPPVSDGVKIDGPLGIIAGRGPLPCVLAASAAARGLPLHIVAIRGEARDEIERFPHTWIKWGEIGKMFAALDQNGCEDLVIIGGVNRPDLANVRFDLGALKTLPFLLSLGKGGDDHVLSRIVRFFEDKGYRVHGAGDVAPEIMAGVGKLGDKAPSAEDQADIDMAFDVVRRARPLRRRSGRGGGQGPCPCRGGRRRHRCDARPLRRAARSGPGRPAAAVPGCWSRRRSPGKRSASTCRPSGPRP